MMINNHQTTSGVMIMIDKNAGIEENMDLVAEILEALVMRGHVEEALGTIDLLNQNRHTADVGRLLSVLSKKGFDFRWLLVNPCHHGMDWLLRRLSPPISLHREKP
ncbi:unnamed protein product [Brassica oleracea]|uniref:(rape) hypothetical protein n=1 Tax=Brassica napus TaxID=3708 RepID=A0A816RG53_BRANA|nr:unnamed protein product [Brassica napus]